MSAPKFLLLTVLFVVVIAVLFLTGIVYSTLFVVVIAVLFLLGIVGMLLGLAQKERKYLLRYGFTIILLAVFLFVVSSICVFCGSATIGPDCIGSLGFLCSGVAYSHVTGQISLITGQDTGSTWNSAIFAFAPQGTPTTNGIPDIPAGAVIGPYKLLSDETQNMTFSVVNAKGKIEGSVPVGSQVLGSVWACYDLTGNITAGPAFNNLTGCNYIQIAVLNARAA